MSEAQKSDGLIATSVVEATIHAPIGRIDLTEWVFTLTDAEYQACSTAHIAGGSTLHVDGKRMSVNVEHVGNLMIQHYVEDISERSHCRLVSVSDSIGPTIDDRTKVIVIWEFIAEAVDAMTTKFMNRIELHVAPGYLDALKKRGITLEQARAFAGKAISLHNSEEAPLYGKDIERKAIAGRWDKSSR
ncbi:hypothetical protein [Paraburkholderia susongensis]|uniref:Uncharacterized protein n=1 Tax=Paraburkholderia susongensis TaxID=1515439 RepID=A0A1X7M0L9_9BURK|nr:hypothetical protein [Paraburkholderia susongensis]SMG59510.1 hypothetical protein SAMN06265784_11380 [Paraburkholderia susongensis]